MRATFTILDSELNLECAEHERKRLEDLAKALNQRLSSFSGEADAMRRLVLTALALMDEAQTTGAALTRARTEIERLTDMVVEARLEAAGQVSDTSTRGGVASLRVAHGAA